MTREEVAIKLECIKTRHPQLHIESKFYKLMQGGGKFFFGTIKICPSAQYKSYISISSFDHKMDNVINISFVCEFNSF